MGVAFHQSAYRATHAGQTVATRTGAQVRRAPDRAKRRTGSCELMRQGLHRKQRMALPSLAFVKGFCCGKDANREVRRLHERPGEIAIAALAVRLALSLPVAEPLTVDTSTVGDELADAGEAADVAYLQSNDHDSRIGPVPVTVLSIRNCGDRAARFNISFSSRSICSVSVSIAARAAMALKA